MNEIGKGSWLGYMGRGNRVQVGDNGFSAGVDARASGQSGESALGVDLKEAGLEILAVQETDGLEFNIGFELSTDETTSEHARSNLNIGGYPHGNLSNGSPDRVGECIEGWLL